MVGYEFCDGDSGLELVSTGMLGALPVATQAPLWQVVPVPHTLPHAPQLLLSPLRLVSHPLPGLRSQSPNPALHDAIVQTPLAQVGVPLLTVQAMHAFPLLPQAVNVVPDTHVLPLQHPVEQEVLLQTQAPATQA